MNLYSSLGEQSYLEGSKKSASNYNAKKYAETVKDQNNLVLRLKQEEAKNAELTKQNNLLIKTIKELKKLQVQTLKVTQFVL